MNSGRGRIASLAVLLALAGPVGAVGPPPWSGWDADGGPLPPGARMRLGTQRFRAGANHLVAVSADGSKLVVLESNRSLQWKATVLDGRTGRHLRTIDLSQHTTENRRA